MIVASLEECKNAYSFPWNITNNGFDEGSNKILCVKDEQLNSTICYGDSGGQDIKNEISRLEFVPPIWPL